MADLAKCEGKNCPLKEKCYRYTCKEDKYFQAWLSESPYDHEKKECSHRMYVRRECDSGGSTPMPYYNPTCE